jgi:SAM-dependent methyltransferase
MSHKPRNPHDDVEQTDDNPSANHIDLTSGHGAEQLTEPANEESVLSSWYCSGLGEYLLGCERPYVDDAVHDAFGFYALQLGLPQLDFLRESRIANRYCITPESYIDAERSIIRAQLTQLPLVEHSVDLIVAPHVLEFDQDPHSILREIHRVLMPEGRLILIGFNPWSLWGLKRALAKGDEAPWQGRYVSLPQIKDWLTLLGFDITAGKLAAYAPPFNNEKWRSRSHFFESLGDRWWGVAGGIYMLQAVKRVPAMRILQPTWRDQKLARHKLAQATRRNPQNAPIDSLSTPSKDFQKPNLQIIK